MPPYNQGEDHSEYESSNRKGVIGSGQKANHEAKADNSSKAANDMLGRKAAGCFGLKDLKQSIKGNPCKQIGVFLGQVALPDKTTGEGQIKNLRKKRGNPKKARGKSSDDQKSEEKKEDFLYENGEGQIAVSKTLWNPLKKKQNWAFVVPDIKIGAIIMCQGGAHGHVDGTVTAVTWPHRCIGGIKKQGIDKRKQKRREEDKSQMWLTSLKGSGLSQWTTPFRSAKGRALRAVHKEAEKYIGFHRFLAKRDR